MNILEYNNFIQRKAGEKDLLLKELDEKQKELSVNNRELLRTEKAQIIIQEVAKLTQDKIVNYIDNICNSALVNVFGDEYKFNLEFITKRNKTECEITLMQNGKKFNPIQDNGGGLVDIISFALRIALYKLKKEPKLDTIILDEPFKFLSSDLKPFAGEILKELSEQLNIQFIIVSHDQDLIDIANRTFFVKKHKKISKIDVF